MEEFANNSNVKEKTVIKRYREIPGITKKNGEYKILSGTRYPYDKRKLKVKNSEDKRYCLLQAISEYRYISRKELKLEKKQFEDMLNEMLAVKLIKPNNLSNSYGANPYDCTGKGDEIIHMKKQQGREELVKLIAIYTGTVSGTFVDSLNN
jgi:hypothetical protein